MYIHTFSQLCCYTLRFVSRLLHNITQDTDFKVDSLQNVVEQLVAKTHSQEKMLIDILQELKKRNKQQT